MEYVPMRIEGNLFLPIEIPDGAIGITVTKPDGVYNPTDIVIYYLEPKV